MHKFIFLKKYLPVTIAIILHVIVFSFFLQKPRDLVYPNVSKTHLKTITFDLKSSQIKITPTDNLKKTTSNQQNSSQANNASGNSSKTNVSVENNNMISENVGNVQVSESHDFIFYENPIYPTVARERGIEGFVKVKINFNQNGLVDHLEILESSHSKLLEESVTKSLQKWKVTPRNQFEVIKSFEFKLK